MKWYLDWDNFMYFYIFCVTGEGIIERNLKRYHVYLSPEFNSHHFSWMYNSGRMAISTQWTISVHFNKFEDKFFPAQSTPTHNCSNGYNNNWRSGKK